MLELESFMPISFLKEERSTGSHSGVRPHMEKLDLEGENGLRLNVAVWSKPHGHDATPEEEEEQQILSFDADGIAEGMDWLNEQFEGRKVRWKVTSHS